MWVIIFFCLWRLDGLEPSKGPTQSAWTVHPTLTHTLTYTHYLPLDFIPLYVLILTLLLHMPQFDSHTMRLSQQRRQPPTTARRRKDIDSTTTASSSSSSSHSSDRMMGQHHQEHQQTSSYKRIRSTLFLPLLLCLLLIPTTVQAFLHAAPRHRRPSSSFLLHVHQQHPHHTHKNIPHLSPSPLLRPRLSTHTRKASDDDDNNTNTNNENENAAIWGLTDLGNANFGKFGGENDPHRNIRPQFLDASAPWKSEEGVDFLPELREIQMRIQGVNVYLVGMPGSGKTTMGRMLAEGLNYRWMDLDQFIEQKLGKTATQVFEEDGEEAWRKQETLGMGALQTYVQTVVSTGGGIMQKKENFPFLHSGLIVWLDLPPEAIVERMKASGEIEKRPLLKNAADPVEALEKLYSERKKNYGLADVRVVLRPEDNAIRCLKRVTHRIIEELDLRPPKAKMWEEKRNKMKNLWEQMKAKGIPSDINAVPEDDDAQNPAIDAIAKLNAGEEMETNKAAAASAKGFGKDVKKGKGKKGQENATVAAVGSQGVGFGLGLDEYMGNPPAAATPAKEDNGEDEMPEAA